MTAQGRMELRHVLELLWCFWLLVIAMVWCGPVVSAFTGVTVLVVVWKQRWEARRMRAWIISIALVNGVNSLHEQ